MGSSVVGYGQEEGEAMTVRIIEHQGAEYERQIGWVVADGCRKLATNLHLSSAQFPSRSSSTVVCCPPLILS
jgi:hypothetical protein